MQMTGMDTAAQQLEYGNTSRVSLQYNWEEVGLFVQTNVGRGAVTGLGYLLLVK